MSVLRTTTGNEFPCNYMGVSDNLTLYVQLQIEFTEVISVFTNPEETKILSWIGQNNRPIQIEEGFTEFGGFSVNGGEYPIRVRMLKKIEVG